MLPLFLVGTLLLCAPLRADVHEVLETSASAHSVNQLASSSPNGEFWWMSANSPLKAAYDYYKKCAEKNNCLPAAAPGAPAPQPFRPQDTVTIDIKSNPFLNGASLQQQGSAHFNNEPAPIDISKNPFLSGVVTTGNGAAIPEEKDGFLGVQPQKPFAGELEKKNKKPGFATVHPLEQKKPGFATTHPLEQKIECRGAGFICVEKELCVGGVVNRNGEGLLQARIDGHYCDKTREACCQLPSSPSNLNEITAGKSSIPGSTIKFSGGLGLSPGLIQVLPVEDNSFSVKPRISLTGESGNQATSSSTAKTIRDTSGATVDYSDVQFANDVRFGSTFQGPAYLPPIGSSPPPKYITPNVNNQYVPSRPGSVTPQKPSSLTPQQFGTTPRPYQPSSLTPQRPYQPSGTSTLTSQRPYQPSGTTPQQTYQPSSPRPFQPSPTTNREYLPPQPSSPRPNPFVPETQRPYQPSPSQPTSRPYQPSPSQPTSRPYNPPTTNFEYLPPSPSSPTPRPYQPSPSQPTSRPYQPSPSQPTLRPYQPSPSQPTSRPYQPSPSQPTLRPYQPSPSQPTLRPYQPSPSQPTLRPYQPSPSQPTSRPYQPSPSQPTLRPYQPSPSQPTLRPYNPPTTNREYLPPAPSSPTPRPYQPSPSQPTPRPYQPTPRPYQPSPSPPSPIPYQPSPSQPTPRPYKPPTTNFEYIPPSPSSPTPRPYRPSQPTPRPYQPSSPSPNPFIPSQTSPAYTYRPSQTPRPYQPSTNGYSYPTPTPAFTTSYQPSPSSPRPYQTSPTPRPFSSTTIRPNSDGYKYPTPTPAFEYPINPTPSSTNNVNNQYIPPRRPQTQPPTNQYLPPVTPPTGGSSFSQDEVPQPGGITEVIVNPNSTPKTFPPGGENTAPPTACAAALKCVQEIYCTADGFVSPVPVVLTKEQELARVPTTVCQDQEAGIVGKCCRDPNYKDPWPSANLVNGVDDGQYKEDDGLGQYRQDLQRNVRSNQGGPRQDFSSVVNSNVPIAQEPTCGERHLNTNPPGPGPLDVNFAEIPWQAMILRDSNRSLLCGGAIIRRDAVLTTAHCVDGIETSDILIKGGEWKLGIDEEPLPFQIVKVVAIVRHPQYVKGSLVNDLAILVLEEKLRPAKNIGTICLPSPNQIPTENCIATGWGKRILQLHAKGAIMHSIGINVMDNNQCQATLSEKFPEAVSNYSPNTLCGFSEKNQCKVDYGSALACSSGNNRYTLAGIFAWDTGCKQEGQIGGYVAPDVEWIESSLAKPVKELKKLDREYRAQAQ